MHSRYSSAALRAINDRNKSRLPPATAVHGMALYELNRAAEQERLFHDTIFAFSELKQASAAQHSRLDSIERSVKACASHHDNERPISLAGGKQACESTLTQACQAKTPSQCNQSTTPLTPSSLPTAILRLSPSVPTGSQMNSTNKPFPPRTK